jgi:signal transduction histidine kinase
MPRDTQNRRSTRSAPGAAAGGTSTASRPFATLLAQTGGPSEVLPHLHQRALDVTGGVCSLLFRHNPRNGLLQATSAFGLDVLHTDPWLPDAGEAALVARAFERHAPALVADAVRQMPDLAARLNTRAALLVPLVAASAHVGLLAIGFDTPPDTTDAGVDAEEVGDAFIAALELFKLRQDEDLRRDVRALIEEFSASLSATLNLAAGLDIFCHGANRLFAADCTSVWIHNRLARHLELHATSHRGGDARGLQVSAEDTATPAAVAMRQARADIVYRGADEPTAMVTVPLRGCRRALGTMVMEGVRVETGGDLDVLDRADELGRQLSNAIENMQLLDEVIRARRELENTFDSIAHLVAVSDMRGRIVHVNQVFASRSGLKPEDMVDRPLTDYIGPELGGWLARLWSATEPRDTATASLDVVDPVLKGPFAVTVTDLLNHDREPVGRVLVARDRTPQTRLEAEREELRKRMTQTEKLATLGQFVAGIAHELNNPLQGVLGHLELLRTTGAFPKQLRPEIRTIYREADRAAKIVRNLLVFAGSRRLANRAVSLNAVLQKVVVLRAPACRAMDIEVVRHYDDKLPRVQGDSQLLHQAFLNMVMNAEHAIASAGAGGRIELATAVAPSGDGVMATVRDTGPGIPEDVLSRIFEPFYTTKEVGKGTGLGLAIAYGIVQDHGGQIVAANHPDGGAVFTVELPTSSRPRRPRKPAGGRAVGEPTSAEKRR